MTTSGAANKPNPVINFTKRLRFDIYTDKALKVAVGCREATIPAGTAIGSDGGSGGGIEWAGVTGKSSSAPICTRTIASGAWTNVTFNFQSEPIVNFSGGNGVLSTTSGLGVLEHFAFVPAAGNGAYNVYIDNLAVTAPKTMTYTLDPGAPSGAAINPTTGVFSWTPSVGQGPATYNVTVRVTDNGTPNQSATKTFTVTVNAPPRINAHPMSQTISQGSNATFSAVAAGSLPLTFQWKHNGTNIAGATTSSYTRTNAQLSDAGNYSVSITNAFGSVTSSNAVLTVNVPPSISAQPQDQTVVQGTNVVFAVTVTGTAPLNYQWRKANSNLTDGGNVFGSTSSALTLSGVTSSDANNYSCVITNVAGSVTSVVASLIVNVPPSIVTPPQNVSTNVGSTFVLSVSASGTSPLSYQWKKDNVALSNNATISGALSPTLTVSNSTTNTQSLSQMSLVP